jgi:hypothetical protein
LDRGGASEVGPVPLSESRVGVAPSIDRYLGIEVDDALEIAEQTEV